MYDFIHNHGINNSFSMYCHRSNRRCLSVNKMDNTSRTIDIAGICNNKDDTITIQKVKL